VLGAATISDINDYIKIRTVTHHINFLPQRHKETQRYFVGAKHSGR